MREQDKYNQGEGHFEYTQLDLNDPLPMYHPKIDEQLVIWTEKIPASHNSRDFQIHELREH